MKNLTVDDLQGEALFQGLTNSFFSTYDAARATTPGALGVSTTLKAPKTPLNENALRMYHIAQSILTPQRGQQAQHVGARLVYKSAVSFMDTTANNETIAENAESMVQMMIQQDGDYFAQRLYGDALYVENVQLSNAQHKPQFLLLRRPISSMRPASAAQGASSGAFQRQKRAVQLQPAEVITRRDVMKGVDYISQVIFKEAYSLETQFFACTLFHRVLSNLQLRKQEIKLLAALCIFEATKIEENYGDALGTSALVSYFSDTFTVQDMLAGELRMLEVIDWRVGVSSLNTRSYLRCLIRDMGLPQEIALLATFLSEVLLMSPDFLRFPFYEQALGCIEVAILALWNSPLQKPMTSADVQSIALLLAKGAANLQCNEFICRQWAEIAADGRATQIFAKYSEDAMFGIARKVQVLPSYAKMYQRFVSAHVQDRAEATVE